MSPCPRLQGPPLCTLTNGPFLSFLTLRPQGPSVEGGEFEEKWSLHLSCFLFLSSVFFSAPSNLAPNPLGLTPKLLSDPLMSTWSPCLIPPSPPARSSPCGVPGRSVFLLMPAPFLLTLCQGPPLTQEECAATAWHSSPCWPASGLPPVWPHVPSVC